MPTRNGYGKGRSGIVLLRCDDRVGRKGSEEEMVLTSRAGVGLRNCCRCVVMMQLSKKFWESEADSLFG